MRSLDIGIIGSGTAGAAAALFLARAGHTVTVYERVEHPKAIGAGILLQPTGQAVLARLGLRDSVLARAAPIDDLRCERVGRRRVFRMRYAALPGGHQGYGLHRGVLFEQLFAALQRSALTLKLGVEVRDLAVTNDRDGQWFVTTDGRRLGPHALCIVADGARSQLRDDTLIPKRIRPYPWGALWYVADDPDGVAGRSLVQVVDGTRHMVGALPTGLGPGDGNTPKVSLFYSVRADRVQAWKARGLDAARRSLRTFLPQCAPMVEAITSLDDILFTQYQDVSMWPWHTDRVVYLGDAAHAMSPQMGQGANLALWDAMTLADALDAHDTLPAALAAYSHGRRSHLRFYQYATRWLTPWFQSDLLPLGWLRDLAMPIATAIPAVERLMVRAMAGLSQGIGLGRPLSLPEPP